MSELESIQDELQPVSSVFVEAEINRPQWQQEAPCNGSGELFMSTNQRDKAVAKLICRECVEQPVCLEFALNNGEKYGVWGGTTPDERGWTPQGNRMRGWLSRGKD